MSAPDIVLDLIERFERNKAEYKSGAYNETQLRLEFLDPLFEAMGWDVHNKQGYAAAYRDVIHEDAIKIGGFTKAPDYCFRVGGARKFFVEAKKPFINIKEDISPAFQLRRYAWSAKLPLSILSDFEELAVYDCRVRPVKTDKASTARTMFLNYTEYADRWDEIIDIFSPEAIKRGSFDRYAESTKTKKGTAEVDDVFLKEIESWRDLLARSIALRNPALTQRELNYAVQVTIDRIIFLRICEDRGIEQYGQLMALQNGENVYARLKELFGKADDRYNSGLFHFSEEKGRPEAPDELTFALSIDDKPLKEIFKKLYYPESPYEFSVLSADILGQVYEQFLGKVIRLTAGHQAKIEDKPEVKKAGGVFYTPTYIVDYIVKETVGKLLEGKTPRQAAKLRIVDPACGSGSFLIGAYQHLLDWHLDRYAEAPEKHRKVLYRGPGDEWRLTTAERKRILLNNIYGVDIDAQAVEVTKLSLLLKVLEGENEETLIAQLKLFQERALPDLGSNIKCGNSLIGSDFYDDEQLGLFLDTEERMRINVFDWETEFEEIMKGGGFDAVIGNPPYLRIQGLQEYYGNQIEYFSANYKSAVKRFDLYLLFAEKGYSLLSKNGRLGFICPNKFLNADFGSGIRDYLLRHTAIERFVSFGHNMIFKKASTYTGILVLRKAANKDFKYFELPDVPQQDIRTTLLSLTDEKYAEYSLKAFTSAPWVLTSSISAEVIAKLAQQPLTLGGIAEEILVGVQSGIDSVHVLCVTGKSTGETITLFSERANREVVIEKGLVKPFLRGEDVQRYETPQPTYVCIYPYELVNGKTVVVNEADLKAKYPLGYEYLSEYRAELKDIRIKQKTNPAYWYSCHRSRNMAVFEEIRIVTPEISRGCNMTIASPGVYHNTMVYSIVPSTERAENMLYWLGLLNSKVMWWFLANTGTVLRGGYFRFKTNYLKPFPVRLIDFTNPTDKAQHDKMVSLVERMLELHKQLQTAKVAGEKTAIQRQIDATDRAIDRLVYELYDLTEEEIAIVEEATR